MAYNLEPHWGNYILFLACLILFILGLITYFSATEISVGLQDEDKQKNLQNSALGIMVISIVFGVFFFYQSYTVWTEGTTKSIRLQYAQQQAYEKEMKAGGGEFQQYKPVNPRRAFDLGKPDYY